MLPKPGATAWELNLACGLLLYYLQAKDGFYSFKVLQKKKKMGGRAAWGEVLCAVPRVGGACGPSV